MSIFGEDCCGAGWSSAWISLKHTWNAGNDAINEMRLCHVNMLTREMGGIGYFYTKERCDTAAFISDTKAVRQESVNIIQTRLDCVKDETIIDMYQKDCDAFVPDALVHSAGTEAMEVDSLREVLKPCSARILETVQILFKHYDRWANVYPLGYVEEDRGLDVDLRISKDKVYGLGLKFVKLGGGEHCANSKPRDNRGIGFPKVHAPLLMPFMTAKASLVFVEGAVWVALPFKGPNCHNLFALHRGDIRIGF